MEQPVYFDWQLLNWPTPSVILEHMQLRLEGAEPSNAPPEGPLPSPSPLLNEWLETQAPAPTQRAAKGAATSTFKARGKPDYAEQDKKNRTLGALGEKLVVESEKRALKEAGREDLAKKVRHIAEEEGDGAGYDVLSFFSDCRRRYIEVKATRGSINSGFFLSPKEIEFSAVHPDNFELRRLYDLNSAMLTYSFYSVFGNLKSQFALTPTEYKVSDLKSQV